MGYHIYYDKSSKVWIAYWTDKKGNQVGESVNSHNKDMCLIYLGMSWEAIINNEE